MKLKRFAIGFVTCLLFLGWIGIADSALKAVAPGAADTFTATTKFAFPLGTSLSEDVANTLAQKNGATDQLARRYGGNSGYEECGSISENLTLSTSGATTDTAANLLPANAVIKSVTARITTTITTATDWKLGDATTAGRFTAANATLTAGTTSVGLVHIDVTGAGGPRQTAAAKLRVTTTGTPGAGAIRITSYYCSYTPATS